jgi:hypothetical protein
MSSKPGNTKADTLILLLNINYIPARKATTINRYTGGENLKLAGKRHDNDTDKNIHFWKQYIDNFSCEM